MRYFVFAVLSALLLSAVRNWTIPDSIQYVFHGHGSEDKNFDCQLLSHDLCPQCLTLSQPLQLIYCVLCGNEIWPNTTVVGYDITGFGLSAELISKDAGIKIADGFALGCLSCCVSDHFVLGNWNGFDVEVFPTSGLILTRKLLEQLELKMKNTRSGT